MLFDDVELFFDEFVGNIQGLSAAGGARLGSQLVLFSFEMNGEAACVRWA
jgi:hypothetical protein